MPFIKINQRDIKENAFNLVNRDWFLITAKKDGKVNTMTASWGGMGHIWNKDLLFCVVRPQRYTREFMEASDYYTLSFFKDGEHRKALNLLGSKSGRDTDKIAASGLTLLDTPHDTAAFEEAQLVFVLKKVYYQDMEPKNFLAGEIESNYPSGDYHRIYFGEVAECLSRA